MDHLRSAFSRMIKNKRYSRFTLQPTEEEQRHTEINLCDDSAEADGQPGGSPSFRPAPLHQNRCHSCVFVLGLLLVFVIGCLIGHFSQAKPQAALGSCGAECGVTVSQTEAPPAADIPAEETELAWSDITQLLKQKLGEGSFTKTLRYSQEHQHV